MKPSHILAFTFFLFCLLSTLEVNSQIIFSENFSVLLDSTKKFKGSFSPELKIQTQKELLIEASSVSDLVFRIKNNTLTIAQKTEFTSLGGVTALSGGYFFSKFKGRKDSRLMPEYHLQIQWADARGLGLRLASGINARLAVVQEKKKGIYFGSGVFLEHEEWNYKGVKVELLPTDLRLITKNSVRFNNYASCKYWIADKLFLDASIYYQSRFDELFTSPRLASSTSISWQLTKYLQFGFQYQNIYDPKPVVPIKNWFHRFTSSFSVVL